MLKAAIFHLALAIVSLNGPANAQDVTNGDLRLVDGITNSSGRVEVYFNGRWGLICNDRFDNRDVRVAYRQLGFGDKRARLWPDAPSGNGDFLLDNLGCIGNETLLSECTHNPWGEHNCGPWEAVGVECDAESYADDLRLVGASERSGSLQVRYAGRWGNVCSLSWGQHAAEVACRTLGFESNAAQVTYAYGTQYPSLFLTHVSCSSNETSLSKCSFGGPFYSYCEFGRSIGLHCLDISESSVREIGVRLNRGSDVSGRLEVSISGIWGTVCGDGFNHQAAQVVCRMLNLPTEYALSYRFMYITRGMIEVDPATEIWLDDVHCDGTEETLLDCQHSNWTQHNCGHHEDIGVFCTDDPHARDHHGIRLVGSDSNDRGRVEVDNFGIWGTVCEAGWGPFNTKVVCQSLNLPYGRARVTSLADFLGTGPVWLADVRCRGKEQSLFDCFHRRLGEATCSRYESVAVICE